MLEIKDDNINNVISENDLALVYVSATWCSPCTVLKPVIEKLSSDYESVDNVSIVKVDVDENEKLVTELVIRNVPSVLLFKKGKEVERIIGYNSIDFYKEVLNKHMN